MSNFRRRLMMSIKKEEKYTQLEYIEKNGFTQYINTGLIPQPEWTYEFDFERTGKFSYLCGSDISWDSGAFNISIDLSSSGGVSGVGLRTLNFGKIYVSSNLTPKINERLIIKKTPNQFIIGTNTYNINIGNIKAEYPLVIFTTNRNGQPQIAEAWVQQYRLYRFSIKNANEELIMNLLPCLDKNGTPCMYDTISKQAFYNQGTGEFLYKEKSLFNTANLQIGYAISASGVVNANKNFNCTEFIPVNQSKYIFSGISGKTSNWNLRIHAYDENKNWIKQILLQPISVGKTLDVNFEINDETIKYIRASIANENFTDYSLITLKEIS